MNEVSIKVYNSVGHTVATADAGGCVNLMYGAEYQDGDRIGLTITEPGVWLELRLDDAMLPALVYVTEKETSFPIPFGSHKLVYSPKAFSGDRHLISARVLPEREALARRNMALNPFDVASATGIFPHASANIETRGESVFAARNTIDGVFANASHGEYPYHSWGINRRADAEIKVEFGVPAKIDEVRLTLRADFPHDNYWTEATLEFSNGDTEVVQLRKTGQPQSFAVDQVAEWMVVRDLIMSDEPSPFPALTQVEVWGQPVS